MQKNEKEKRHGANGGLRAEEGCEAAKKGRIIFVNSFKGGAGKTTLSLMHCISGLFHGEGYQNCHFENVVYLDLDILGTGICYLFNEKLLTEAEHFGRTGRPVKVLLRLGRQEGFLYVAYLDPKLKMRASSGENRFVNHQTIAIDILKNSVTDFIKNQFEHVPETLLVVDCAPGFSELEQKILEFCFELAVKKDILVEENYVTTLDAAHVRKCIESMNDIDESFDRQSKFRSVHIVINDIQNYVRYLKEVEETPDAEEKIKEIVQEIKNGLKNSETRAHFWRYSPDMAKCSVFTRGQKVENHVEDYLFTRENYNTTTTTHQINLRKTPAN